MYLAHYCTNDCGSFTRQSTVSADVEPSPEAGQSQTARFPEHRVIGGVRASQVGRLTDKGTAALKHTAAIHRLEVEPMDGGMDVPGGPLPAGPAGSGGGVDEQTGSISGVQHAPGHGAVDVGLFCAARLPAAGISPTPQAGTLRRRHRRDPRG